MADQPESVRQIFDQLDEDQDGLVSIQEVSQLLPTNSLKEELVKIAAEKKELNFEEFEGLCAVINQMQAEDFEEGEEEEPDTNVAEFDMVRAIFDKLDSDNLGKIKISDLRALLPEDKSQEFENILPQIKCDEPGVMSFEEFYDYFSLFIDNNAQPPEDDESADGANSTQVSNSTLGTLEDIAEDDQKLLGDAQDEKLDDELGLEDLSEISEDEPMESSESSEEDYNPYINVTVEPPPDKMRLDGENTEEIQTSRISDISHSMVNAEMHKYKMRYEAASRAQKALESQCDRLVSLGKKLENENSNLQDELKDAKSKVEDANEDARMLRSKADQLEDQNIRATETIQELKKKLKDKEKEFEYQSRSISEMKREDQASKITQRRLTQEAENAKKQVSHLREELMTVGKEYRQLQAALKEKERTYARQIATLDQMKKTDELNKAKREKLLSEIEEAKKKVVSIKKSHTEEKIKLKTEGKRFQERVKELEDELKQKSAIIDKLKTKKKNTPAPTTKRRNSLSDLPSMPLRKGLSLPKLNIAKDGTWPGPLRDRKSSLALSLERPRTAGGLSRTMSLLSPERQKLFNIRRARSKSCFRTAAKLDDSTLHRRWSTAMSILSRLDGKDYFSDWKKSTLKKRTGSGRMSMRTQRSARAMNPGSSPRAVARKKSVMTPPSLRKRKSLKKLRVDDTKISAFRVEAIRDPQDVRNEVARTTRAHQKFLELLLKQLDKPLDFNARKQILDSAYKAEEAYIQKLKVFESASATLMISLGQKLIETKEHLKKEASKVDVTKTKATVDGLKRDRKELNDMKDHLNERIDAVEAMSRRSEKEQSSFLKGLMEMNEDLLKEFRASPSWMKQHLKSRLGGFSAMLKAMKDETNDYYLEISKKILTVDLGKGSLFPRRLVILDGRDVVTDQHFLSRRRKCIDLSTSRASKDHRIAIHILDESPALLEEVIETVRKQRNHLMRYLARTRGNFRKADRIDPNRRVKSIEKKAMSYVGAKTSKMRTLHLPSQPEERKYFTSYFAQKRLERRSKRNVLLSIYLTVPKETMMKLLPLIEVVSWLACVSKVSEDLQGITSLMPHGIPGISQLLETKSRLLVENPISNRPNLKQELSSACQVLETLLGLEKGKSKKDLRSLMDSGHLHIVSKAGVRYWINAKNLEDLKHFGYVSSKAIVGSKKKKTAKFGI